MKRLDVYVKDEQYEEWKKLAESQGKSLSEFVKEAVESALKAGFVDERHAKNEITEGRFKELNTELNMLWEVTGKLNDALKKLNRGEALEQGDFAYPE